MKANWKAYLIDLDGTLYHGTRIVPGADRFISYLNEQGIPYLFVTNNSSRTPEEVAKHLTDMGIQATADKVLTSALGAARHLLSIAPEAKVAVIGEHGLVHAMNNAGFEITEAKPDYVIQGIDHHFNYERLKQALDWISGGAKYILTNPDLLLPTNEGLQPGAGTLSAAIQAATGVVPVTIGKPEAILIEQAMKLLGVHASETAVIGDNMLTDILAGVKAGCGSILTLTGVTTRQNLAHYQEQTGIIPDFMFADLHDLYYWISGKDR